MINAASELSLKRFSDEKHTWVEIPLMTLVKLDIQHNISAYSYQDNVRKLVYLEGSSDFGFLVEKASILDLKLNIQDVDRSERDGEFVRELDAFRPPPLFWKNSGS